MSSPPSSDLRELTPALSVGVMAGGESALAANLEMLQRLGVGVVHVDVMDGRFVPVDVGGIAAVMSIESDLRKDVHLMIEDPIEHVAEYAAAGADLITVHVETRDPGTTLRAIADLPNVNAPGRPVSCGLALLPSTQLQAVSPLLDLVDVLLVLAVTPGVPGTDPAARIRLADARAIADDHGLLVAFDGGVKPDDVAALAAIGADLIVSGSAIFAGPAPAADVVAAMQAQLGHA
jgi:ribulose-phosphate 3-epimerase